MLHSIMQVGTGTSAQYHAVNQMWAQVTIYDYQWNYVGNVATGFLGLITSVIYVSGNFYTGKLY